MTSIFKMCRARMDVDMSDYTEKLIDLSVNEGVQRHTPDNCSCVLVKSFFFV